MRMMDTEARGIPYGRAAEVHLSNNHASYIFTWSVPCPFASLRVPGSFLLTCVRFGLSAATAIMLFMVLKKPPTDVTRRVRQSRKV
jgi:surfeit locus 1 family protein